jgi:hypothetical protein
MGMKRDIWIDGDDRSCVLRPFAMRLWDARDDAILRGTSVQFPGGDYAMRHGEPDEFSCGVSRVRMDGNTFLMAMGDDHMTRAFDAVTAWRLMALVTGRAPVLPPSVEIPEGPPETVRRAGPAGWLLGRTTTRRAPAATVTDPMEIARHECWRLLHGLIVAEGAHPEWGRLDMTVGRGIDVHIFDPMTASHPDGGLTRVPRAWSGAVRQAIMAAQRADPRWVRAEEHHASQPEYGWEI